VDPAAVLSAYRAASGGDAWQERAVMKTVSVLTDVGLTGSRTTVTDLRYGYSETHQVVGPAGGASGFDGSHVWIQGADGRVSLETGMAVRLAVDTAYQNANLWWRPSFGGAKVTFQGNTRCRRSTCAVLKVTPRGGWPFEAWFDVKSHLLVRTIHSVGTRTITDYLSDYRMIDGVRVPYRSVIKRGPEKQALLTIVTKSVVFLPKEPLTAFAPPKSKVNNATIVDGTAQTSLPFRLLDNHIFANVWVNGHGPLLFIFDTGGQDLLMPSTAEALAIPVDHFVAPGRTAVKANSAGLAMVHSIGIGRARFTDQAVGVLDFAPQDLTGLDIKGMIGAQVFKAFVIRFNYGTREITLIKPSHFKPKDAGTPIPFDLVGNIPVVNGIFDGIPGKFAIDTGAATALLLTRPFVAEHHLRDESRKGVVAVVGHGEHGNVIAYVTRAKLLTVGPFKFPDVVTSMALVKNGLMSMPLFQGAIGGDILKHFIVTLDYANSRIYLKPLGAPLAKVGAYDRSGLALGHTRDGFRVAGVTARGPARQAGIEIGDLITEVNGKPAASIPLQKVTAMLRHKPPGTVVHLTLKRGTHLRHVAITLRDQI